MMPGEDIILMSGEELRRLGVIRMVLDRGMRQAKAAGILGLSGRQVRRMVKRVRQEADRGIVHKSRGRPSNRRLPEGLKERVLGFYREKYPDFGPSLATEKLAELDGIKLGGQTLRNWLLEAGLWKKRRKGRKQRRWRQRKEYRGEMVQMDGSHHDWLEGRGPELVLMGYIDDATNDVFGRFYDYEGTLPALDSFQRYVRRHGLPQSVYLDRHTTYRSPAKPTLADELAGRKPMSQFERAVEELKVKVIHAHSPQAKGRIERLFRTFQDRLIKEMRLKDIKTKAQANSFLRSYLPRYNRRFGREPSSDGDLHRPVPAGLDLDGVLCIKRKRALRNDSTIAHNRRLYQILGPVRAKSVIVEERINGSLLIRHQGRGLNFQEIPSRPKKEAKPRTIRPRKAYIPPKDHPWRRFTLTPKNRTFLNVLD
jgi:transposase